MSSVNKVIVIGRLGKDPETKQLPGGGVVCNFSVATSESWTDKATGEKKELTTWHRVTAFGRLADICASYLQKGKMVYIEGKLRNEEWEKDGVKHTTTKIMLDSMQMLSPRDSVAGQQPQPQYQQPPAPQYQQPRQPYPPQQPPAGQYRQPPYHPSSTGPEQGDIPF